MRLYIHFNWFQFSYFSSTVHQNMQRICDVYWLCMVKKIMIYSCSKYRQRSHFVLKVISWVRDQIQQWILRSNTVASTKIQKLFWADIFFLRMLKYQILLQVFSCFSLYESIRKIRKYLFSDYIQISIFYIGKENRLKGVKPTSRYLACGRDTFYHTWDHKFPQDKALFHSALRCILVHRDRHH